MLDLVEDGTLGPGLDVRLAAVPELGDVQGGVVDGRAVAHAEGAAEQAIPVFRAAAPYLKSAILPVKVPLPVANRYM